MADETVDPTQPATPAETPQPDLPAADTAPVEEPAVAPVPVVDPAPVDPTPGDTPSTSQEPSAPATGDAPAQPVVVDNFTTRSDDDALLGSWVDVVSGPFAGRYGAYVETAEHDEDTGYPSVIVVRSRDSRNELLHVAYSDVRPSERTGGR